MVGRKKISTHAIERFVPNFMVSTEFEILNKRIDGEKPPKNCSSVFFQTRKFVLFLGT